MPWLGRYEKFTAGQLVPLKLQENLKVVKLQEELNYISRSLSHAAQTPPPARHLDESEDESEVELVDESEAELVDEREAELVDESEDELVNESEDESEVELVDESEVLTRGEAHATGSLGLMDQLFNPPASVLQEQQTTNQQQTVGGAKATAVKRKKKKLSKQEQETLKADLRAAG